MKHRRGTVEKQLKKIIIDHWPSRGASYNTDGHHHHPQELAINLLTHDLYDNCIVKLYEN